MLHNTIITKGSMLLRLIVLGGIILLLLSFFGVRLESLVESEVMHDNTNFLVDGVVGVWDDYLHEPLQWFWTNIFIEIIWNAFVENMQRIKNGEPTYFQEFAPQIAHD